MNSPALGLRVAGVLFGVMALAQLGRLIVRPEVLVAGRPMPLWPSAVACAAFAALSFWMFVLSRNAKR